MAMPFRVSRAWFRHTTALSLIALLLLAQLSVAAYACPGPASENDLGAGMMMPSANESDLDRYPQHPSLCHDHCKDAVALSHGELPGLPPAVFTGLVVPPFDRHRALLTPRTAEADGDRLTAPPPRILFCVFRS